MRSHGLLRWRINPEGYSLVGIQFNDYSALPFAARRRKIFQYARAAGGNAIPTLRAIVSRDALEPSFLVKYAAARALIGGDFGDNYVPHKARVYKSKAKNAQEAHEAIRPTDAFRRPGDVSARLDDDQNRLYQLIWNRAIASQMESAVLDQVSADIGSADGQVVFRATGSTLVFNGFYKLYREGNDDSESGNGEKILPKLTQGQGLERRTVTPEQHFTQPPPRFTEASLVKRLEELGIGRPSTYASIISVLQERNYVRLEKRRFEPVDRGRLVTAFLDSYFTRYVEYNFTAYISSK